MLARARLRGARDLERRLGGGARQEGRPAHAATRRWRTRARSSPRPTCRSPATWRTASANRRRTSPRRSASPPRPAWSAARSRTSPATRRDPFYDLDLAVQRIAAAAEAARAAAVPFTLTARCESTSCAATPTSPRRSPACRPTRRRAPTCCSRRRCPTSNRSARLRGAEEAAQFHGRHSRQVVQRRRARRRGRQAHQPRDLALPRAR